MANTVLGKVSVVPRGDYNASTTYYALDIVGYEGGSYLAMQQVTGVTPSNDQVNWMQLSGPGLPGADGTDGTDGVTFTPSVSEAGVISWTNDGGEDNPDPVNIMGPQGNPGAAAGFGEATATVDETTGTPSVEVETSGPDTAKVFSFSFSGLKGETGAQGIQGIQGPAGTSVASISRTSGTGAAGTTDTYTMYDSEGEVIGTFTVYNGSNGTGSGDFMANGTVPMTGALDMGGQRVTNVGAPTASTDAVRQSDLKAVSDEVDDIISGTTAITIPAATEAKRGGVIIGDGLSVEADGTVSADDQLPTGGTQGQVLTQGTTGPEWQDAPSGLPDGGAPGQVLTQGESGPEWTNAPDPLPTGGEVGQVLTKTSDGTAWDDVPSDLPDGGTDGQILTKTADGVAWEDAPEAGVTSFKGRTGAVTPQDGDYTADMVGARPDTWTPSAADVGAVPTSRTVNGKALSQDISLTADNVGARPSTWTPTASDVGAIPDPSGGTTGQILEKTATGTQWADKPSGGISQSEADARYLQLSGGTMTGPIHVTGESNFPFRILSIYDGTNVVNDVGVAAFSGGKIIFYFMSSDLDGILVITPESNGQCIVNNIATPTDDDDAANKAYVDSLKPTRLTAVLSASGWSGNSQTITVNGVITDTSAQDIDISCADKASADAWAAGGVWCSNPTQANKLTFTCTTPPTANINLNIRLWEVG